MSLMCFFLFKQKRFSPFLQKTGDVEVKLVKYWGCKGEGLASFGNSNTYCVSPYMAIECIFLTKKRRDILLPL